MLADRRFAAAVLAVAASAASCAREPEATSGQAPDRIVVGVAEASIRTLVDSASVVGQVVPATSGDWTITAPEPALIAELPKNVGDEVAVGELLVRFDIPSLSQNFTERQMMVSDADVRTELARAEVNRLEPLFEQGLVARVPVDTARATLAAAEAAQKTAEAYLEEARLLRDGASIRARFPGVIAERWHAPGEFASGEPGDPILRVVDPTRLEIAIELPIDQALRLRDGHPATVFTLAAGMFTAVVARRPIGMLIEGTTTPVRLTAPEVSGLTMNDVVQVDLVLDERRGVLAVPVEAFQRDGTTGFVMVADPDGVARRRPVRAGLTAGGFIQIDDGVQAGEYVIVQGLVDVSDGSPIQISR